MFLSHATPPLPLFQFLPCFLYYFIRFPSFFRCAPSILLFHCNSLLPSVIDAANMFLFWLFKHCFSIFFFCRLTPLFVLDGEIHRTERERRRHDTDHHHWHLSFLFLFSWHHWHREIIWGGEAFSCLLFKEWASFLSYFSPPRHIRYYIMMFIT